MKPQRRYVLWLLILIACGTVWFWPFMRGVAVGRQTATVRYRKVTIPRGWRTLPSSSDITFVRPGPTICSVYETSLRIKEEGMLLRQNQGARSILMASLGFNGSEPPAPTALTRRFTSLGLMCGQERSNPISSRVAVGCLSSDYENYLEFSGSREDVSGAISIARQVVAKSPE